MARPLRRVLIGLSIRIGLGSRELERYDMPTIREYLAMLSEINKPTTPEVRLPERRNSKHREEMMAAVNASLGHLKE
jgi:hypothetical protein